MGVTERAVAIADQAGVTSAAHPAVSGLRAEIVPAVALPALLPSWTALRERALESNVFLEPSFALPLLGNRAAATRWSILLAWAGVGAGARLVGLLPIRCPRLRRGGLAVGFRDPMLTCGTPLLDRDCADAAFAAMLACLSDQSARPAGLLLTGIAADGSFAAMLAEGRTSARGEALPSAVLADYRRAALRRAGGNVLSLASAKTRKERKRQRRRLSEQGERAYIGASTPDAVARATERFLALERKGWKGMRGTALLANERLAAFTRAMTAAMAAEGKCRVDALEVNGEAIAMGIVLTSGDRAHFWKTAFDEELASLSPGVQFAIDLAEVQLGDPAIALTDSCAVPDHPMIDRLWPDRLAVLDVAVGLAPGRASAFDSAVAGERRRRALRGFLKEKLSLLRQWLRR